MTLMFDLSIQLLLFSLSQFISSKLIERHHGCNYAKGKKHLAVKISNFS